MDSIDMLNQQTFDDDDDSSVYSSDDGLDQPLNLALTSEMSLGVNISDDDLISLSVRDLNRMLKGLSPADVKILKQRRRTLKNRGYAANCREKRMTQKEELEMERSVLRGEVQKLRNRNTEMGLELTTLKSKYAALKSFADRSSHGAISKVIVIKPEGNNNSNAIHVNSTNSSDYLLDSQGSNDFNYESDESL